MRKILSAPIIAILAGTAFLAGCSESEHATDSKSTLAGPEHVEADAEQIRFSGDYLKLKSSKASPASLQAFITSHYKLLQDRSMEQYREAVLAQNEFMAKNPNYKKGFPTAVRGSEIGNALAKTQACHDILVKDYPYHLTVSFDGTAVFLNPGDRIQITARAIGSADPYTCLYSSTSNNADLATLKYRVCSDDVGGSDPNFPSLSSRINYTHSGTGAWFSWMAFSPNGSAGYGSAEIKVIKNGNTASPVQYVPSAPIAGLNPSDFNVGNYRSDGASRILVQLSSPANLMTYTVPAANSSGGFDVTGNYFLNHAGPTATHDFRTFAMKNGEFAATYAISGNPSGISVRLRQWSAACTVGR